MQNYFSKRFALTSPRLFEMTYYTYTQTSIEYTYFFLNPVIVYYFVIHIDFFQMFINLCFPSVVNSLSI